MSTPTDLSRINFNDVRIQNSLSPEESQAIQAMQEFFAMQALSLKERDTMTGTFISDDRFVITQKGRQDRSGYGKELLSSLWGIVEKGDSWTRYAPVNEDGTPYMPNAICWWHDQIIKA